MNVALCRQRGVWPYPGMDTFGTTRTARVLRRKAVETMTGLARSTIYQRLAEGTFPKQIHLGPRCVGWLASEIEDWIAARISESRPASPDEVSREAQS